MRSISAVLLAFVTFQIAAAEQPRPLMKFKDALLEACQPLEVTAAYNQERLRIGFLTDRFNVYKRSKSDASKTEFTSIEGPTSQGILIIVTVHDGKYEGADAAAQTVVEEDWHTYVVALNAPEGKSHLQVRFSYGDEVSKERREKILKALNDCAAKLQYTSGR